MSKFGTRKPNRTYIHTGEAWYAETALYGKMLDEIIIGDKAEDGGTCGEFAIRWSSIGGRSTPQLEAFHDSWAFLAHCKDLIDALAEHDDECLTPKQVCEILDILGFKDITKRVRGDED